MVETVEMAKYRVIPGHCTSYYIRHRQKGGENHHCHFRNINISIVGNFIIEFQWHAPSTPVQIYSVQIINNKH